MSKKHAHTRRHNTQKKLSDENGQTTKNTFVCIEHPIECFMVCTYIELRKNLVLFWVYFTTIFRQTCVSISIKWTRFSGKSECVYTHVYTQKRRMYHFLWVREEIKTIRIKSNWFHKMRQYFLCVFVSSVPKAMYQMLGLWLLLLYSLYSAKHCQWQEV